MFSSGECAVSVHIMANLSSNDTDDFRGPFRGTVNHREHEKAHIWEITDSTVRTWINEAVDATAADGVTFSVPVTPHTFRHSYGMHMLYAGIPLKVLQSLMGHKSVSSTEVYTKVFALDVAARHRVQFQMSGTKAVAMLKGHL